MRHGVDIPRWRLAEWPLSRYSCTTVDTKRRKVHVYRPTSATSWRHLSAEWSTQHLRTLFNRSCALLATSSCHWHHFPASNDSSTLAIKCCRTGRQQNVTRRLFCLKFMNITEACVEAHAAFLLHSEPRQNW